MNTKQFGELGKTAGACLRRRWRTLRGKCLAVVTGLAVCGATMAEAASTSVSFAAAGGTTTVQFKFSSSGGLITGGAPSSTASWLSATRSFALVGGQGTVTIVVKADANTSSSSRSGTITVSGTGGPYEVYVTQSGVGKPNLSFSTPSDWPASGYVTSGEGRTDSVNSFKAGSSIYLNFCYAGSGGVSSGTHQVSVTITTPSGKTKTSTISEESLASGMTRRIFDWKFYTASETGTYKVSIKLDSSGSVSESNENDNTKTISFTVTGSSQVLTLGASGRTFSASAASSKELSVKANVSWTAKSNVSWLKVKKGSGSGNGTIVYDVAANSGALREGTITVSGGSLKRTFYVTQEKGSSGTLTLGATSRSFSASAASSKELSVKANVSWTAKSNVSWLKVKKGSGSGNGTIVYDVAANTGSASRTGKITVTGGSKTATFTVTQSGKTGGSGASLSFGASGGTQTAKFTFTSSGSLSMGGVQSSVSWMTATRSLSSVGGQGTIVITVKVSENTSTGSRSGTASAVVNGKTYTVTVTQSGKKAKSRAKVAGQVWVTTSDGSDGAAVADGDEATGWSPSGTAGSWVALTFEEPRSIGSVAVKGEGLPDGLRALVSEDGDDWSEEGGDAASYLWVILPDEGGVPTVTEIVTEP